MTLKLIVTFIRFLMLQWLLQMNFTSFLLLRRFWFWFHTLNWDVFKIRSVIFWILFLWSFSLSQNCFIRLMFRNNVLRKLFHTWFLYKGWGSWSSHMIRLNLSRFKMAWLLMRLILITVFTNGLRRCFLPRLIWFDRSKFEITMIWFFNFCFC